METKICVLCFCVCGLCCVQAVVVCVCFFGLWLCLCDSVRVSALWLRLWLCLCVQPFQCVYVCFVRVFCLVLFVGFVSMCMCGFVFFGVRFICWFC